MDKNKRTAQKDYPPRRDEEITEKSFVAHCLWERIAFVNIPSLYTYTRTIKALTVGGAHLC